MNASRTLSWFSQSDADVPRSPVWLAPGESARADSLRFPKRRADYLLGRWTAKCAVARVLGRRDRAPDLAGVEIRNAPGGAPEAWVEGAPAPLSISMTDRSGWGVCAVHEAGASIGCDLEVVEPRTPRFVEDYFTAPERARVAAAADEDQRHALANLIWCAKESALKVLRTGLRRDTRSVEVTLESGGAVDGWLRLHVVSEEGTVFPGWWRRYGDFLLTFAASAELPPPVSLVQPPALDSATPREPALVGGVGTREGTD